MTDLGNSPMLLRSPRSTVLLRSNTGRYSLGMCLLVAYLTWSLVGKSNQSISRVIWQQYQIGNVVLSVALIAFVFVYYPRTPVLRRHKKRLLRVIVVLCTFIGWGFICSAVQERAMANLLCFSVYATMILALFIIPQIYLRGISISRFLAIIMAMACLGTLGSLFAGIVGLPGAFSSGRLAGIYHDPLICTNMAVIGFILLLWHVTQVVHNRLLVLSLVGMIILSALVVILTRSRGGYVCFLLCPVCLMFHHLYHRNHCAALAFLILLFPAIIGFGLLVSYIVPPEKVSEARAYARIDASPIEISEARTKWWKPGFEQDLRLDNVFGVGFLAAYDWGKGDRSESGYDIERNRHNAYLSCAQSYGMPGVLLFILFLISAGHHFFMRKDPLASLGFTCLVYCMVRALASNHLLGFGLPMDRFTWLIMGVAIHFTNVGGTRRLGGS